MNTKGRFIVSAFLISMAISIAVVYGDTDVPCTRCDPDQTCSGSVLAPQCTFPGSVCTFDPDQTIQTLTVNFWYDSKKGAGDVACYGRCSTTGVLCAYYYPTCSTQNNEKRSTPCFD